MKSDSGIDLSNTISVVLEGGIVANLQSAANCVGENIGVLAGSDGNLILDNVNNPQ